MAHQTVFIFKISKVLYAESGKTDWITIYQPTQKLSLEALRHEKCDLLIYVRYVSVIYPISFLVGNHVVSDLMENYSVAVKINFQTIVDYRIICLLTVLLFFEYYLYHF